MEYHGDVSASSEDGVTSRANERCRYEQDNSQDDLALNELDDTNYGNSDCNEPKQ